MKYIFAYKYSIMNRSFSRFPKDPQISTMFTIILQFMHHFDAFISDAQMPLFNLLESLDHEVLITE